MYYIPIPTFIINIAVFTILVTLGTKVLARIMYSKDKHHSGMDIDQTKEAYERHRKNG